MVSDAQVRKLMKDLDKKCRLDAAAARAGMDEKTARKYRKLGKLPSELKEPRKWRTRADPFEDIWPELQDMLKAAPELEAKALFEWACAQRPGKFEEGQLRTLQRKVHRWRSLEGPEKEVFFAQEHRPGEAMQTDFTELDSLGVTVNGEPLGRMLCHCVLPYSNWEWGTLCRSESFLALRRGCQAFLWKLGRRPEFHQTDQTTAATHNVPGKRRKFNEDYTGLMEHLGMTPRLIGVGQSNQNGDIESSHGVLKRRIKQHLLLRGSHDFSSVEEFELFVQEVMTQANLQRQRKFREELEAMSQLVSDKQPEFREERPRVSTWSTIRVDKNSYSVPSRLIGEQVRVRIYEDHIEVRYAKIEQLNCERLLGKGNHKIDYRHIIWSLVQKPGAFERYRYREDLFPALAFRKAYDALCDGTASTRQADLHYLRVLHLAASTMEVDVATALELLLESGTLPTIEAVEREHDNRCCGFHVN